MLIVEGFADAVMPVTPASKTVIDTVVLIAGVTKLAARKTTVDGFELGTKT